MSPASIHQIPLSNMAAPAAISELREGIINRLQELVDCIGIMNDSDLAEELEEIQRHVTALDSLTRIPEELFNLLNSARSLLTLGQLGERQDRTNYLRSGRPGRPTYAVSKEQLEILLNARFKVPAIAELLHISCRTVERRMHEYDLSARASFSEIHDNQLDDIVNDIKGMNPSCGSKMLVGYLGARGIFLPRRRIRESLTRVDPLGVAARKSKTIKRRTIKALRWQS